MLDPKPRTAKEKLYADWLYELKDKIFYLTKCSGYLTRGQLDQLGIELSEIEFETGDPLSSCSTMQLFRPTENSGWTSNNTGLGPITSLKNEFDKNNDYCIFLDPDDEAYETDRACAFLEVIEEHLCALQAKNKELYQWESVQ